jgi:hypothetical protein
MGPTEVVPPDRRPTSHVVAGGIVNTWSFCLRIFLGEGDITRGSILAPAHRCEGGRQLLLPKEFVPPPTYRAPYHLWYDALVD